MRYMLACLVPLMTLSSPLRAQNSDSLPPAAQQGGSSRFEVFSGVEFQQIELKDGQDIDKLSVPVTARLTTSRLRITAQLPYTRVTGPGNVVAPSGPLGLPILVDPTQPAEVRSRDGLGDARVGVSYDLGIPRFNVSLNIGAKLPTASVEKGLGTGKADYWVGADMATTIGAVTPFAGVSYSKTGDPAGFELRDTVAGQAGAALRLSNSTSAHAGYSYSERASDLSHSQQRLFGGVNTAVGNGLSLGFYGSAGVNGPADIGAGVSLGIGLN